MNLRNYDNLVTAIQLLNINGKTISTGDHTSYGDGQLTCKLIDGTIYKISGYSSGNPGTGNCFTEFTSIDTGLVCGSGDTAVTYDDYKLASIFSSSEISYVSCSCSDLTYDETTNTFQKTLTKVFTAKTDITIKEIGFYTKMSCHTVSSNNASGSYYTVLTYREVLDEPIEVAANSNFTLTLTTIVSACANKPAEYNASVTTE